MAGSSKALEAMLVNALHSNFLRGDGEMNDIPAHPWNSDQGVLTLKELKTR